MPFRYLAERLIEEGISSGELLPALPGGPIAGLDETYDPAWWAKALAQREAGSRDVALRHELEEELRALVGVLDEFEVRARLERLRELVWLDVDLALASWRRGDELAPLLDC